jgi:hypothetical protein
VVYGSRRTAAARSLEVPEHFARGYTTVPTGLQSTGAVAKNVGKLVVLAFQGAELSSVG